LNEGPRKTALVIGAEKLSSLINWQDRNTCVLFGDGAGAVVLRHDDSPKAPGRVLSTVMGSDGTLADLLKVPGGGSACPITAENVALRTNTIHMEGTPADVKLVIPHQANARIITAIAERLGVPGDRTLITLDVYGNSSAAPIPVALDEAHRTGRVQRGDVILMVAFGGGFTWASSVLQW
jgi:3-oxoacyl-[acyl-carrier-protein] synthase III